MARGIEPDLTYINLSDKLKYFKFKRNRRNNAERLAERLGGELLENFTGYCVAVPATEQEFRSELELASVQDILNYVGDCDANTQLSRLAEVVGLTVSDPQNFFALGHGRDINVVRLCIFACCYWKQDVSLIGALANLTAEERMVVRPEILREERMKELLFRKANALHLFSQHERALIMGAVQGGSYERNLYADWLEERGEVGRASLMRRPLMKGN